MKKHPLSMLCAYVMLGALVIFGLAGVAIEYVDLLPPEWRPVTEYAQTAIVGSLAAAFVAAALASMLSAAHAERAHQAGPGHNFIMWLAIGYTAVCIVIEVTIGKLGARMIGAEVNTLALTGLLTFFAVAPRAVSWILAGLEGIDEEKAIAAEARANKHIIEATKAAKEASDARIAAGAIDLDTARNSRTGTMGKSVAAIGAAAALMGTGVMDLPEASANVPTFEERPQGGEFHVDVPEEFHDASQAGWEIGKANIPTDGWKRGPRVANRDAFVEALNIVRRNREIGVSQLSRELDIDRKTAKIWKGWALSIIEHPSNAELLEAA